MDLQQILDSIEDTEHAINNEIDLRLCHSIENELYSMIHGENSYGSLKDVYNMIGKLRDNLKKGK